MNHRVVWLETGQSFEVAAGEAVLEAALRGEIALPLECQFGGWGTCRIKLVEGAVGYTSEDGEAGELPMGLSPEEAEAGFALACQARPSSDLVISVEQPVACSPLVHTIAVEWPLLKVQRSVDTKDDEWQVLAAAVIGIQKPDRLQSAWNGRKQEAFCMALWFIHLYPRRSPEALNRSDHQTKTVARAPGVVAALLPARNAASVNPITALQDE